MLKDGDMIEVRPVISGGSAWPPRGRGASGLWHELMKMRH
jgi:hypothetical protein